MVIVALQSVGKLPAIPPSTNLVTKKLHGALFVEKLTVVQHSNFHPFMESWVSLKCSLVHTLSKMNPVFIPPSELWILFNIILKSTPRSSVWSLVFWFSDQNLKHTSHRSHSCYMPCHLIFLNLIILIFDVKKQMWSSSLCSFLQYFVTSSWVQIFSSLPCFKHPQSMYVLSLTFISQVNGILSACHSSIPLYH